MKKLTVISFYTDNGEYPAYADRLRTQCDALNLNHLIEKLPDTGDRLTNSKFKPKFISDCISKIKGPILWVDVDNSLLSSPNFILDRMDTMDFMVQLYPEGNKFKFHISVMFFNNTEQSLFFLNDWITECAISPACDELHLDNLWKRYGDEYTMQWCEIPRDVLSI